MTIPGTQRPTLVIFDDDPQICRYLEQFGRGLGFEAHSFSDPRTGLPALQKLAPTAMLVDLNMPGLDGLQALDGIREQHPECAVVMMTGYATVDTAVKALRRGALDYLMKPLDRSRLRTLLAPLVSAFENSAAAEAPRQAGPCGMIGTSAPMQQLYRTVERIAPYARVTLVQGETGTGKELVARALHQLGPRRSKRFVVVNCSAIVTTLFESELFGHVRGAFTGAVEYSPGVFEAADGGTLFLDEVGELPLSVQAKLLRALEYGQVQPVGAVQAKQVDVHVIAATNRSLHDEAAAGRFRHDLLYRLNVVEVVLPPLRDRREDIPALALSFVQSCSSRTGLDVRQVTPEAMRRLTEHSWPGNVRELHNAIERSVLLADGAVVDEAAINAVLRSSTAPRPVSSARATEPRRRFSNDDVQQALERAEGNKAAAARLLGISRRALYRLLEGGSGARDAAEPQMLLPMHGGDTP